MIRVVFEKGELKVLQSLAGIDQGLQLKVWPLNVFESKNFDS